MEELFPEKSQTRSADRACYEPGVVRRPSAPALWLVHVILCTCHCPLVALLAVLLCFSFRHFIRSLSTILLRF